MIHHFKCSNFYSIKDEITVDFTSSAAKSTADGFTQSRVLEGVFLSKVTALFGPNASGKTNVLRVLSFISWLLANSFDKKPDDELPYVSYGGDGASPETNMEVVFELREHLYKYSVQLMTGETSYISFEQVSELNTKTNQFNTLYKRSKPVKDSEYDISYNDFSMKVPKEAMNRDNSSLLSIAAQFSHARSKEITSYWKGVAKSTNVDVLGGYSDGAHFGRKLFAASKYLFENQDVRERVTDLLNRMDIGLSEIKVEESKHMHKSADGLSQEKEITLYETHFLRKSKTSENKVLVPAFLESTGVKSLFSQLTRVLVHLKSDVPSILVWDEIDSGVHPELIHFFLDLFRSPEFNPSGHQLLVTLHSNQVMDDLEKNQIYLTRINDLKTEVYPLDSIKNVRKDISYSASYRAGRFGAIPNLD